MNPLREQDYLLLPWTWNITPDQDGGHVMTIAELPDFFAAGATPAEATRNARDALLSHVRSYLARGQKIPQPRAPRVLGTGASSSSDAATNVSLASDLVAA